MGGPRAFLSRCSILSYGIGSLEEITLENVTIIRLDGVEELRIDVTIDLAFFVTVQPHPLSMGVSERLH